MRPGLNDHHGIRYMIRVPLMGCIITRTNRHIKMTAFTEEEYLRNEVAKKDKRQGANRLNELLDHYTKLYEKKKPK